MSEDKILQKLTEHDAKFDKVIDKLSEHDEKFDKVFTKLTEHDEKFDKVINKLVDHEVRLQDVEVNMVTKEDLSDAMNGIYVKLDSMTSILNKLDQERLFSSHRMDRIEEKVEKHSGDIATIKESLNIA